MQIGVIGLGRTGSNFVRRFLCARHACMRNELSGHVEPAKRA